MSDPGAVGRVLFINTDGKPQFTAFYSMPGMLREPELCTAHGVYRQNHQLPCGKYVYKYFRTAVGPPDTYLTDYRDVTDANWDGPVPEPRKANWDDVNAGFESVISNHGGDAFDLIALQRLAYAAWHNLPVLFNSEPLVSVTRPSPPPLRAPNQGSDFDGYILEEP